ncbi:MAG: prealbumin-like fold domain-containing protein, partial [Promicromonosporaceae bacterium]|nr:prealbumin-like fold domain-containing protein [Promicromonosporaceae bacterium]
RVTNTTTAPKATFGVSKVLDGPAAGVVPAGTEFTVGYTVDGVAATPLKVKVGAPVTGISVPDGATVKVTETTFPTVPGVIWGSPTITCGSADPCGSFVASAAGTPVVVTVTNHAGYPDVLIQKVGPAEGGTPPPLDGAEFALLADDGGRPGAQIPDAVVPVAGNGAPVGRFAIRSLAPGTYWLLETKAPDGYALLAEPVRFTVTNGTVTTTAMPQVRVLPDGTVEVTDLPRLPLPFAGSDEDAWRTFNRIALPLLALALAASLAAPRRRGRHHTWSVWSPPSGRGCT